MVDQSTTPIHTSQQKEKDPDPISTKRPNRAPANKRGPTAPRAPTTNPTESPQSGGRVSRGEWSAALTSFLGAGTISAVAEVLGRSREAARRLIEVGVPEVGLPPLEIARDRIMREQDGAELADPISVVRENIALVRRVKGIIRDQLGKDGLGPGEVVRVSGELDRLLIRETALIRAATEMGAVGGGSPEAMIAALSDDDLDAVADGGEMPAALVARFVGDAAPVDVGIALRTHTHDPSTDSDGVIADAPGPDPALPVAGALGLDAQSVLADGPVAEWLAEQKRDLEKSEPDPPADPTDLLLRPRR